VKEWAEPAVGSQRWCGATSIAKNTYTRVRSTPEERITLRAPRDRRVSVQGLRRSSRHLRFATSLR